MSFLTPAFLLGALALAIPVLIHLTHREKRTVVEFPSLMFLRRIPYRSVRRQKLRHLFLFALRCLALLLLALAFARPFFEAPRTAAATALGPREVVLLVDRSYSMGYEDRFSRARAEALAQIRGLGPDDRGSVIAFSDRAEILQDSTSDVEVLRAAVEEIDLSSRTTRYGPAIKLAKRIVDESKQPRRQVLLISDFQRLGWEGDEDAWLPAGTTLVPVNLGTTETQNVSVTGVILERDRASGRERLRPSARVTYKAGASSAPSVDTALVLSLGGRSLQSEPITLAPNSSKTVSFEPVTLPSGPARGTIRTEADALPADDAYHFVIWPGQSLTVLVLESAARANSRSFYLERALAIGDRPSFRTESKSMRRLTAADLSGRDVVLLNDVSSVGDAQARLLSSYVERGGGLVVVLGESSGGNAYTGAAAQLLPAPPGAAVDRARDWGGTLSYLDYGSTVFELFSAPHSGDFSTAKFFRYRTFEAPVREGVLARFDDGAVALAEKRLGEGRVLVWTSTLDTFWNDLARQPVFLPFVHQLMKHAAGYAEANPYHQVGEVVDLTRWIDAMLGDGSPEGREGDLVVSTPSEETMVIPPTEERPLLALEEQGFYELRLAGLSGQTPMSVAANLNFGESDLALLDPDELVASVSFREAVDSSDAGVEMTPSEQEGRQAYWRYLLLAAFVLLVSETVLSNRLSRASTIS